MPGNAAKVQVAERQLLFLEEFRRSRTEPRWMVERASSTVLAWERLVHQVTWTYTGKPTTPETTWQVPGAYGTRTP